jgi:predicted RNase H-like HicB family nuclease
LFGDPPPAPDGPKAEQIRFKTKKGKKDAILINVDIDPCQGGYSSTWGIECPAFDGKPSAGSTLDAIFADVEEAKVAGLEAILHFLRSALVPADESEESAIDVMVAWIAMQAPQHPALRALTRRP